MRTQFQLIFLACCGGLAGLTVAFGPDWVPSLSQNLAFGLGAAILFGCGLVYEVSARLLSTNGLRREVAILGEYCDAQQVWLEVLEEAFERTAQFTASAQDEQAGRTVNEVLTEAKVLKNLIPLIGAAIPAIVKPAIGGTVGGDMAPGFMPPVAENSERAAVLDIVRAALRDDRVDLALQPIVSLPERKRCFYECFSRLRNEDGTTVFPQQYIGLAEGAGLITAIDNMLLFRCVQLVRKIHGRNETVDFFCNISSHTISDGNFFADFVDFVESNPAIAANLVFEFGQVDFARWSETGAPLLDRLASLGCRFSLDQVEDLEIDASELAARHVAFIKIDGDMLLEANADSGEILRTLRHHEIDLIVTKVEDEDRLLKLLDYGIDFGQGFLFGEPRLARPAA
jgi:cyclic-di-GMP phosphodiesterase TipF (flagellum assembly factor)